MSDRCPVAACRECTLGSSELGSQKEDMRDGFGDVGRRVLHTGDNCPDDRRSGGNTC